MNISLGKTLVVLIGGGIIYAIVTAKPVPSTPEQRRAADIERLAKACWKKVKPGLKDPNSGDLYNWSLAGNVITIKYRAKNAFGAVVPSEGQCEVSAEQLAIIGK